MSEHNADHSPLPCARIIATNPHWKTVEIDGQTAGFTPETADYIVRACNAYPLAEEMARLIERNAWVAGDEHCFCAECGASCLDRWGRIALKHKRTCELARLLQAVRDAGLLK